MTDFDAESWAARFTLLSDPTRLRLVAEMHARPGSTVTELATATGITENAASQSIRKLRAQGWVRSEKAGRMVHYEVVGDAIVHRILHDIIGVGHISPGQHADHTHAVTMD
ncbi:winged helix-turn-helix transcriptional regulator [Gordonia sp. zg691]|uniref:Winged helix-turn-helix transcriptional regulator n=1 Tax=Gordonia jinghuaiqii TaxID=2758710 RepID=A0A7D7QWT6_9ACTN|nr:metalloregulator ArsR/SmtB family transcription factor [Gordonia jinghuaiqii]MBD0860540.1 winged helix-turn-helix transcriptional regulator [Gordonia jinghuaiqii]MCR5978194.1 metalloregulator ArsR/SmtB family transcription factor [Gordonia jinghuaiqii]QMT01349.1 winged helix-turn-helix transcriptional regulator [Gordonia jinghuaiqii]